MKKLQIKKTADGRTMLNLGCGNRIHKEWNNLDFLKSEKQTGVISYNILKGIPFPANTFEGVYHSNFLEHLDREEGERFIMECYRVLKNGGTLRMVVPDLELLAKEYLKALKLNNNKKQEYEFAKINLIDQMTRTKIGGYLGDFLRDPKNRDFLIKKMGRSNVDYYTLQKNVSTNKRKLLFMIKMILEKIEIKENTPKNTGELHKWMYDRYSLTLLLKKCGFKNCKVVEYNKSRIKNWNNYFLDMNLDGSKYKIDGLFMEAVK